MSDVAQTAALPRRQVLCGIVVAGLLGSAALAGCTDSTASGDDDTAAKGGSEKESEPADSGSNTGSPAAGGALAQLSEIPISGGKVVTAPDGRKLVILQPAPGEVTAYDAACTHQGTTVGAPKNGIMTCPNHGSRFSVKDGEVVQGPATSPLKSVQVKVSGQSVVLA
jgi:Rieske Fe-S protein